MNGKRLGISLMVAVLCATASATVPAAAFRGLGDLPGGDTGSSATAISADGRVVVGVSQGEKGQEAFYWTEQDGLVGLGYISDEDDFSRAWGVSADGSVIVGDGNIAPFVWSREDGMLDIGTLGFPRSRHSAIAVSDDGRVVVGTSKNSDGVLESFVWTAQDGIRGLGYVPGEGRNSIATDLSADGNVLVGWGPINKRGDMEQPFVLELAADEPPRMLGAQDQFARVGRALGVSGDGSLVVGVRGGVAGHEAFRFPVDGQLQGLGDLPGGSFNSGANAASQDGRVIVGMGSDARGKVAVVWAGSEGIRAISELLEQQGVDLSGWQLQEASDVSADGRTIVGYGVNPDGLREAWIATLDWPLDGSATVATQP